MNLRCLQLSMLVLTLSILLKLTSLSADACMNPCVINPVCWDGFYLSGQLGCGQDKEHPKFTNANYFNTLGATLLGNDFRRTAEGFIGGGALGYQYQMGRFVVGIEGGAVSTNFKKSKASPFFPASDTYISHLKCLADAKLRLGYTCDPYDSLLFFVTGGWAGGDYVLRMQDPSSNVYSRLKDWVNGWTAGVGFDCKFVECYSLGLSYDYTELQFHDKTGKCPNCGSGVGLGSPKVSDHLHIQTLTFRFNYYFNI